MSEAASWSAAQSLSLGSQLAKWLINKKKQDFYKQFETVFAANSYSERTFPIHGFISVTCLINTYLKFIWRPSAQLDFKVKKINKKVNIQILKDLMQMFRGNIIFAHFNQGVVECRGICQIFQNRI